MRDSIEEDLFRGIACAHVTQGGQLAFNLEHCTWTAHEVQGQFLLRREPVHIWQIPDPANTDVRSYNNVDAIVDAFMEQLHLQGKTYSDVVFRRVVVHRSVSNTDLKIEDPWGVTWRHLIARLDVLRMLLLDDKTILARVFEEAKNL